MEKKSVIPKEIKDLLVTQDVDIDYCNRKILEAFKIGYEKGKNDYKKKRPCEYPCNCC